MNTSLFANWERGLTPLAIALACVPPLMAGPLPAFAASPKVGIACTTGAANTPTFNLSARPGYIVLPDGNTMYMWGYSEYGKPFQHPGPVLCVNEGDRVTINLFNTLPQPVSIMFPGQENVLANSTAADPRPAQPQFDGSGNLTSLTNAAAAGTGSVSYTFTASRPGTYLYESGTNPEIQVRMGLFGTLIVRPAAGADHAYNRTDSRFTTPTNSTPTAPYSYTWDEEFLVLLSEIDPYLNRSVESGTPYDITRYHPRYWLLNGRGFPDSIADNNAPWLPSQPYGALARIHPYNAATHPYPGMIRYLNVGTTDMPFHPHGNNGLVIGRDGHPLEGTAAQDLSFEKFVVNIGPGQTWDALFKWYDAENYSSANPVPITMPDPANLEYFMFYGGSPYLGQKGTLPPGISAINECGEYMVISHNHSLFQLNSWGLTMSGPATYMRVDPPLGPDNTCSP